MAGITNRIPEARRTALWRARLAPYLQRAELPVRVDVEGRLTRMVGLTLEAVGCPAAIGGRCVIVNPDN
jgi:flagellum-specific ATP synthase